MSNPLTLFRGDAAKIKDFDFSKTRKHCLVGPGIYLTDSKKIAETYRTKGDYSAMPSTVVLFAGPAKDRMDALKGSLSSFVDNVYLEDLSCSYRAGGERLRNQRRLELVATAFDTILEYYHDGRITAEYLGHQHRSSTNRNIEVVLHTGSRAGYLSEFSFPRQLFESQVIHIDGMIRDTFFWELMFDNKVTIGFPCETKSDYVDVNSRTRAWGVFPILQGTLSGIPRISRREAVKTDFKAVRRVIEPYGFKGFEYNGGAYTGSSLGRHRAFCIWDDDYVNAHKVRRFR